VKGIQLREKDLEGRELFNLAEKVKVLCDVQNASLLINNRIDVALAVDADGVQLGSASIPVQAARELMGTDKLIGVSTHSMTEAEEAERGGADFILFGPIYFTPSKSGYGRPQGLAPLKKVVDKIFIPVYAIGGISVNNLVDVKGTGVRGVALISAIMGSADPCGATQEILSVLEG
jgi:thiamine-phosphate pyrophosphorylase